MGDLKEIFEAISQRYKSPIFGYFFLAVIAINWRALFYLFFADQPVAVRLAFFELNTNWNLLLVWPLIIAAVAAVGTPWLNYGLAWWTGIPQLRKKKMEMEHANELSRMKLEADQLAEQQTAQRVQAIIDRERQDAEIEQLDPEKRDDVTKEIEELRSKRDRIVESFSNSSKDRIKDQILKLDNEIDISKKEYSDKYVESINDLFAKNGISIKSEIAKIRSSGPDDKTTIKLFAYVKELEKLQNHYSIKDVTNNSINTLLKYFRSDANVGRAIYNLSTAQEKVVIQNAETVDNHISKILGIEM